MEIKLFIIERKMIGAKYDGKKIKYWWYKKKYEKMKAQQYKNFAKKNK
jgi:hypothetical protein